MKVLLLVTQSCTTSSSLKVEPKRRKKKPSKITLNNFKSLDQKDTMMASDNLTTLNKCYKAVSKVRKEHKNSHSPCEKLLNIQNFKNLILVI
jgi:hypothetical protein